MWTTSTRNINKGSINFFSLEKEIAMGRRFAAEIERRVKLLNEPTINEYANRVGQTSFELGCESPFTIMCRRIRRNQCFALRRILL